MAKITYNNKTALITNPDIADENKVTDNDMNEIKQVVNENDDKFLTNGLNVSNEVDEDYRVNLLETKNLFNKNNFSQFTGYVSKTNNKLVFSGSVDRTMYIPCKPNTSYTISKIASEPFYICTATTIANNTPVSNAENKGTATTYTITSGANDKYLCLTYYNQNSTQTKQEILDSIQIEEGNEATTYSPFIPKQIVVDNEKYSDTLNVGTSLDSISRVNVLYSKNLLNYNTSVNGIFTVNSTSETLDANNNAITSAWIPCEPNTTYRLYNPNGTSARQRWQTKASNGTITYMGETNTLTTNSTAKYMRVYYYVGSTATSPSSITNVQIEKGSEFTGFEPYITPSIYVDNKEIYNQNIMNYSTSEQRIGTWIDGKPLYRKVIDCGNLPNATAKAITHNISNLDKVINMYGSCSNGSNIFPLPYVATGMPSQIGIYCNSTSFVISTGGDRTNYTGYAILEYTKTTDV